VTLTPGQSTTFTVTFTPTSATTFSGTVTVTSNASNPSLSIALSGTAEGAPAVLTATPTSLTYTNITVGQTSSQTETIKNTGATSATISAVAVSGTGFSVSGITTPVTLTAGQSTTFTVKFAPTSAGTFPGTVTVTSNASNPSLTIPLSGTAVTAATLTASPTSLTYTNITVGQTSSQTETIQNTGGTSATISAVAGIGNRVQHFRDHAAGDVDGGTERDLHGEVCADFRGHVPWNGDGDLERIEPELVDSFERDGGGDTGSADGIADEFDLHEHHGGADLESDRNDPEHGRHERDNFGGRGIGNRVQYFRNRHAGDVDGGTEHDLHGEVCADFRRHVPGNGHGDVERIEPEPVDTFERDGSDASHIDDIADQFDLHEHHGGADFEPDRNPDQHGRHERDNFGGRGIGNRVQHFRNHTAGDVDGGTEHDVHGDFCADICGHVPWNGDRDLERIEPELVDSFEWHGSDCGYFDSDADELNLHEHHGGADFESDRNADQHGGHECHDLGGRGIGNRVQHFRDHTAGDVDGGTERDLHGDFCADVCGHVPWNGDGDLERIEPELVDTFERDGSGSGSPDPGPRQPNLHEHHGGADLEPNRNDPEHGRHERDNFGGCGIGNRVQHFRNHTAGDVDGGTEHDLHGEVCPDVCGHVPRNCDGDLRCFEPEFIDTFEWDGCAASGSLDGIADKFDLHEYHGGAEFESDRNADQHGRHECNNLSGRGIGNRVQCFRDHAAGDADTRTEHDLHGDLCADQRYYVQRNGDGDLERFEPDLIDTADRNSGRDARSSDGVTDEFDLHERHGGANLESNRNPEQHGRHDCHDLGGRGIGNRV
jgi:hypothetical protein